jgi:hypothetical protein
MVSQASSTAASFTAGLHMDDMPSQVMRLITASNINNFEHLVVDLLPPGTQLTLYNSLRGEFQGTAFSVPALRVKAAGFIGGALVLNSFISSIPRFWLGSWQLYIVLLNSIVEGSAAGLQLYHFIKGYRDAQNEHLGPSIGFPNFDAPPVSLTAAKINIPYGLTGVTGQLDFTVGGIPGATGHSLGNAVLETVAFSPVAANPYTTLGNLVSGNSFIRQPFGGPDLFYPGSGLSPVYLTGGVVPGVDVGFAYNGGPFVESDTLTVLDPSFNTVPGNNPIESAPADYYGSLYDD